MFKQGITGGSEKVTTRPAQESMIIVEGENGEGLEEKEGKNSQRQAGLRPWTVFLAQERCAKYNHPPVMAIAGRKGNLS